MEPRPVKPANLGKSHLDMTPEELAMHTHAFGYHSEIPDPNCLLCKLADAIRLLRETRGLEKKWREEVRSFWRRVAKDGDSGPRSAEWVIAGMALAADDLEALGLDAFLAAYPEEATNGEN